MSARRIVITGVSRGLGRALVDRFVELGHTVMGCCRSDATARELQSKLGDDHEVSAVDVADDAQVSAWARRTLDRFGPPDLLLNNAAVINRSAPLWELTADEMRDIVSVNILGVANCVRGFVPAMIARKSGVIVNFSSGWGRSVSPDVAPYCATKFAIEGLTMALALELPRGMAAVPLNPGVINTDMLQACFGDAARQYPDAQAWSRTAAQFFLKLGPKDNGRPLSVG